MDYNSILKEALNDVDKLTGKLNKYETAAADMLNNLDKHVPKTEQAQFAEALKEQIKEMNSGASKAREAVENLRTRFSQ